MRETEDLSVDSIDMTPLAVAICHRLHLMNDNPLPCRACITKVAKALPVLSGLLRQAGGKTAEEIAKAIEAKASDTSYSEPEAVTEHLLAAAQTARQIGGQA